MTIAQVAHEIDRLTLLDSSRKPTLRIYDPYFNLLASTAGDTDSVFELPISVDKPDGTRLVGRIESVIWNAAH